MNSRLGVNADTGKYVEKLRSNTGIDHDKAEGMPAFSYASQQILDAEIGRIFRRDWICTGREKDAPEKGDYFTFDIVEEAIIVVRGRDGKLRAFANICRHRLARLLEGSGTVRARPETL